MTFKAMKELSASEITKAAIQILESRNYTAWRQVNTPVRGRRGVVKKGIADILSFHNLTGLFCACEVKKIGDRLSNDQIEFLFKVQKAGAIALIATQEGDQVVLKDFKYD